LTYKDFLEKNSAIYREHPREKKNVNISNFSPDTYALRRELKIILMKLNRKKLTRFRGNSHKKSSHAIASKNSVHVAGGQSERNVGYRFSSDDAGTKMPSTDIRTVRGERRIR